MLGQDLNGGGAEVTKAEMVDNIRGDEKKGAHVSTNENEFRGIHTPNHTAPLRKAPDIPDVLTGPRRRDNGCYASISACWVSTKSKNTPALSIE